MNSFIALANRTKVANSKQCNLSGRSSKLLTIKVLIVLLIHQVALTQQMPSESQPTVNITLPVSTSSSTPAPTTQASIAAITTNEDSNNTTKLADVDPKVIENIKRIISQKVEPMDKRLGINKPIPMSSQPTVDFVPDSMEAKVSEAATEFGLNFINNLTGKSIENVVISPLSLENILNMLLLGSSDNSSTQLELSSILGHRSVGLMMNDTSESDRLRPHEAIRNVFESIIAATHLSIPPPSVTQSTHHLLNTNPTKSGELLAALQTASGNDGSTALSGQVNFTMANLVLTNKDLINLKYDYERELQTYYKVRIENFSTKDNKSAKVEPLHERVNKWVKKKTRNQIEKLVEESDLNPNDLVMVLLNAAHFKGRWLHTFNVKATQFGTFYNLGKEATEVKFMRQKGVFGYADFNVNAVQNDVSMSDSKIRSSEDSESILTEDSSSSKSDMNSSADNAADPTTPISPPPQPSPSPSPSSSSNATTATDSTPPIMELSREEARRLELTSKLNCSALMLPFSLNEGQELSMVLLLPAKRDGLDELMENLNSQSLNEIYRSLTEQRVRVELPKFNFESSYDAKETLQSMGLRSVFEKSADLNRMYRLTIGNGTEASTKGLVQVNRVIHKVKIGVDESGAEAAAASMITLDLRNFIRPPTPTFQADHPFLFIIRHNRSNMPLFMGKVNRL